MAEINSSPYKGSAQITREQFLFYEMRTTAMLMREGLEDDEIIDRIVEDNLFQYPTEKSIRQIAKACVARLNGMGDMNLVEAVASQSSEMAKQICMYAMMKRYRLVWDFMITVIGEKYRLQNFSFSQMDVNVFFMQLQEQDDYVARWSENTMKKIRQILIRMLVENEYLDDNKAHQSGVAESGAGECHKKQQRRQGIDGVQLLLIGGNMSNINERLDNLKSEIQKPEFLEGKGLSNEVNIRIFCYDAQDEMIVRHFTEQLIVDRSLDCHLVERNLYKVFLSICDDKRITEKAAQMEEKKGKEFLLNNLQKFANNKSFVDKMQYEPHEPWDVLLLTGVGEVFPFMRIHSLLEALQPEFPDIPILVMYPGMYDGRFVRLFDKLEPNPYYRAFNIVGGADK